MNIQQCSSTLTELYLDGLSLGLCFPELMGCAQVNGFKFKVLLADLHR